MSSDIDKIKRPGKRDLTKNISDNEKIHIFFTHHDNYHLEGFRFFIGKMGQVNEITVPLYQNEITLIAIAILNLKGIGKSTDCNEFTKALNEIVNNQVLIKTLVYRIIDKQTKKQLQFMPFYGKIKETAVISWEDPKFIIYR